MKKNDFVRRYPDWVFCSREDLTRENMARYDAQQKALDEKCIELCPEYNSLNVIDRFNIRRKADDILNNRPVREPLAR